MSRLGHIIAMYHNIGFDRLDMSLDCFNVNKSVQRILGVERCYTEPHSDRLGYVTARA